MKRKPSLDKRLSPDEFSKYYWLKQELVDFCRESGLSTSGGKNEITDRIKAFLTNGAKNKPAPSKKGTSKFDWNTSSLNDDTVITDNYRNTENVRAFFVKRIGQHFSFNVPFMNWIKGHAGKTLRDAAAEWTRLRNESKTSRKATEISAQFEYNTYIRDFLADNPELSLRDAIRFWKIRRELPLPRKYSKADLKLKN